MRTWSLRVLFQFLHSALSALHVLASATSAAFKSRTALHLENLALRHQIGVLQRAAKKRPKLTAENSGAIMDHKPPLKRRLVAVEK